MHNNNKMKWSERINDNKCLQVKIRLINWSSHFQSHRIEHICLLSDLQRVHFQYVYWVHISHSHFSTLHFVFSTPPPSPLSSLILPLPRLLFFSRLVQWMSCTRWSACLRDTKKKTVHKAMQRALAQRGNIFNHYSIQEKKKKKRHDQENGEQERWKIFQKCLWRAKWLPCTLKSSTISLNQWQSSYRASERSVSRRLVHRSRLISSDLCCTKSIFVTHSFIHTHTNDE